MLILLPWHAVNLKFDCAYTHEEMLIRCQTGVAPTPCCAFHSSCLLASYLHLCKKRNCVHINCSLACIQTGFITGVYRKRYIFICLSNKMKHLRHTLQEVQYGFVKWLNLLLTFVSPSLLWPALQ